jgi:hypothetical protein
VTPRRADAFVLVEDARAGPDRLLQPLRAEERRRAPEAVDLQHLLGDLDLGLLADLLADQHHWEERREVIRPYRLPGPGMQDRLGCRRHVGADVVSASRELRFVEQKLSLARRAGAALVHVASIAQATPLRRRRGLRHGPLSPQVGVDDLDGTLARLKEQGIEPERPPNQVREGGWFICFVQDPDG